jgi:F-type H+-transporting ATPase subunit epsilon
MFHVVIAKVHENLFNGEAQSLTVPTQDGIVTILSKHEPLVSTLKPGTVIVRTTEGPREFAVTDGVLEVSGNQATVLL